MSAAIQSFTPAARAPIPAVIPHREPGRVIEFRHRPARTATPAVSPSIPDFDGPTWTERARTSYRASLASIRDMGREQFDDFPEYTFNALACDRAYLSGRHLYHEAQIHGQSSAWLEARAGGVDPWTADLDAAADAYAERF